MFDQWLNDHRSEITDIYVALRIEQGDPRPEEALRQGAGFGIDVSIKSVLGEMNWEQATRAGAKRVLETGGSLDALSETAHTLFLAIKKVLEKDRPDQAFDWLGIVGDYTLSGSETVAKVMEANLSERTVALEQANQSLLSEIADRQSAEEALKKANEQLEERVKERTRALEEEKYFTDTVLKSLPGLFYVFDQDGVFKRWNQRFGEVTGYSDKEIAQRKATDYFEGEDLTKLVQAITDVFEKGEGSVEADVITKSGERIPYYFTGVRSQIGDGLFVVGMGLDITDRKQADLAIRESEKKFRALADSTTAAIGITQDDGERFVYANKTLLDAVGLTWKEFSKLNPTEILAPSAREAGERAGAEAKARGDTKYRFEYQTEDGQWVEVNACQVEIDGKESWIWTSFDITEHKLTQQALEAGKLRYRTIFDTAGTGMISFGEDSIITMANDEWIELSGYSKEETIGKLTWIPFFTDKSLARMKRYHEMRSKDPSSVPRAYEAQFVDRQSRIHDGIVNIQIIPGTQQRVASFQDMTDLKQAQQQMYRADKMAALGQIIAGVAHEINNPNNFIYFNLPILRKYIEAIRPLLEQHLEKEPDLKILNMKYELFLEDVYKLLENMEHGSQRITGIVSDLKNYIRSDEAKDFKIEGIGAVINQVMTLVGKQVRKMVKRFDVDIAEDLKPCKMNPGKIEQVLINLVINAGQAADKEDSWVRLAARPAENDDKLIEILVEDNGAGIPKENLDQVFEPFFTSKSREAGTGLGLSISHQIVEEHGGTIEVESELGKWTCFAIRLPVA
ncbi:MAG: PAS domain S-box protein [Proteobacteria bacterium]|nr:PAS domain S-box protein [Pseudomonadota bacterium]